MLGSLVGAVIAVALFAQVRAPIGPFDATLSARPSLRGGTVVLLGPLGTVELETHRGPFTLQAQVDELRVPEAEAIARDPARLDGIEDDIAHDAREGLWALARRTGLAGLVGGAVGGLVCTRRWRWLGGGAVAGSLLVVAVTATSVATFRPRALAEPRYSGLLTVAPTAVGDAQALVDRFGEYRAQLAEFVGNVVALYQVASDLPTLAPADDLVRVLHVSDVHLNPQAYDLMKELVRQFDVDAVVDTGDSTDFGTSLESRSVAAIGGLGVPYVWIRGNHDSAATTRSIAALPNAIVLDGQAADVAGLRFFGVGDPRFTPDKSEATGSDVEQAAAEAFAPRVAKLLRDAEPPAVDVLVVHDERTAARTGYLVPLILSGHTHEPRLGRIGDATLLVEGSTGGAGRRGVSADEREPLMCSILYFDRATRRLVAYDQVSVDGLGERGVRVDRHAVEEPEPDDDQTASTTTTTTTATTTTATTTTTVTPVNPAGAAAAPPG